MAAPNLNTLPAHVLFIICQHLDPATLRNLSLVDRQSQTAARSALFASISITTKTCDFKSDVAKWQSILERTSLQQAVRHLRIHDGLGDSPCVTPNLKTIDDFAPLVHFVTRLPALASLSWACTQQFPEPLFDLLQQRLPSCRLHLKYFGLFSISDPSQERYERRLVSSTNLHAIGISVKGDVDRIANGRRILPYVIGLAPNLRSVDIAPRGMSLMAPEKPSDSSPHAHSWLQPQARQGSLHKLQYIGPLNTKMLSEWIAMTDWKRLRTLMLGRSWGMQPDIHVFEYLTTNCVFEDLESLTMDISPTRRGKGKDENAMTLTARKFLCNLRPLSTLCLSGDMYCAFLQPVLEIHGTRLRRLELSPLVGTWYADHGAYWNRVTSSTSDLSNLLSP